MTKKSRRVASRQAAISKERKRRKQARAHTWQGPVAPVKPADVTAADTEVAVPAMTPPATPPEAPLAAPPEPVARPEVQPASARAIAPRYQYVIAEIRRIGILAGAMVVILIILTFVLG